MGKLKIPMVLMMVVCVLMMGFACTFGEEEEEGQEERKPIKASLTERLTSLLYVSSPSSSSGFPSTLTNFDKLKTFLRQAHAYFFPPNLESGEADEDTVTSASGSRAGETVKEAVTKSMERGKESVEDSAESAAKMAGETVHMTTEKLKKSLSQPHHKKSEEL